MILICSATIVGCEDFLTTENKSSVSDKEHFSTEAGFETLVANAYEKLRAVYAVSSYTTYFQAGTDMYGDARVKINDELHEYETLNPENSSMKTLYADCYKGIRAAYAVKYYADDANISDALRRKRVDEARVVAVQFYYILVNTFGGVPLMKEYVADIETGYPRATATEVYAYMIEELEDIIAIGALEASTATKGGGRASIEAARALLAQTYLAAGWDLDKSDYFLKAAQAADAVIAGRSLTTRFADLWNSDYNGDYSGDDNEEFLWDVEYDHATASSPQGGGHCWSTFYVNYIGAGNDGGKSSRSAFIATLHALKCFEKGDVRYDATFMKELPELTNAQYSYWDFYKNGGSFTGTPIKRYYPAWYETEEDIEAWKSIDPENRMDTWIIPMAEISRDPQNYTGGDITYEQMVAYNYGGSPCRKFDDSYTLKNLYSDKDDYRDIHIITLSEIFLVAAEAYLKAGDNQTALTRLNEVRRRAELADATSVDIDAILKERVCELFGQGSRWFDLRRTQKLVEYNNLYNKRIEGRAQQVIGQKLLRPIPQGAIDANDQMSSADQNPGY
jgi:hypothetical protein